MELALRPVPVLPPPPLPARRRLRASGRLGFTLIEMLMAVALIAVVSVVASPTFVRLMRDRRVNRAAALTIDYFRSARLRAMGRGLPMNVQWNPQAGGAGNPPLSYQGLLRILAFVASLAIAAGVVWLSRPGKQFVGYAQDSITESRKVVWPTRKEAMQVTGMVFLFVFVLALFMWLIDSGLSWLFYDVILGRGSNG